MFNAKSLERLAAVDADLRAIITEASDIAERRGLVVQITEGLRSLETQRRYVAEGKSRTMSSYHLTGRAVDVIINGAWEFQDYAEFAAIVYRVATDHGIRITWGGSWKFRDGPHFQIEDK